MSRIIVQLADVTCWNTEDIHGADEFYLMGAIYAASGNQKISRPVMTRPVSINDNQTVKFRLPALFDGDVPENWYLNFALMAIDEDSAKDWAQFERNNQRFMQVVENSFNFTGSIVETIFNSMTWFIQADQDDILGYHRTNWYPVRSFPHGWQLQTWPISGGSTFYSNWNYQVRYWVGKW